MLEQQNFDNQAVYDYSFLEAALDVQGNDVSEIYSLPFPPGFAYGESQSFRAGNNVPSSDYRLFYPSSPIMAHGNSIHFLPQPTYEVDEILLRLNNLKCAFYENLCVIEELIRRIQASPSRATSPVVPSPHAAQFGPSDFGKLSQDAADYIMPIASSSVPKTAPGHTESWTTTPAASFPFDFSNKVSPRSPIYEIVVDEGVKYFQCSCGHRSKTKADMMRHHKCLKHSKPSYFCRCGKSYTRDDGLDRHQKTCGRQKGI